MGSAAVGDGQNCPSAAGRVDCLEYFGFGFLVQGCGHFIKQKDLRIADDAAGNHQELQLPLREIDVTYRRVQALREFYQSSQS